jgi:hypothetical protein
MFCATATDAAGNTSSRRCAFPSPALAADTHARLLPSQARSISPLYALHTYARECAGKAADVHICGTLATAPCVSEECYRPIRGRP